MSTVNRLRAKILVTNHVVSSDSFDGGDLDKLTLIDKEFFLICRAFKRYKRALTIISNMDDLEMRWSFGTFCPQEMIVHCINGDGRPKVVLEPLIGPDFIDNVVQEFVNLDQSQEFALTPLLIPIHTYLHRIWTKAARSEIRPRKELSGQTVSKMCEELQLECLCSRNYLRDVFVFPNHAINTALNIEITYIKSMHKLSVRFLRIGFFPIDPLHRRTRNRTLPTHVLYDVASFLPRHDLDALQLVSRETFEVIESNRHGFALHSLSTAKLVVKGDFFCFGVFEEDEHTAVVKDFRERRCQAEVVHTLFYPLLRNSSVLTLHIKRVDLRGIFDRFVAGISYCLPTHVKRLVFSAAMTDTLRSVFEFSEKILRIREYEVDVFSEALFRYLLQEPAIRRCESIVIREQYARRSAEFEELLNFLTNTPRPACAFVMRTGDNEIHVNRFLDKVVELFLKTRNPGAFLKPILLDLHYVPRSKPSCCSSPHRTNVVDAFPFEQSTLSDEYRFQSRSGDWFSLNIGVTTHHPVRRICYIKHETVDND